MNALEKLRWRSSDKRRTRRLGASALARASLGLERIESEEDSARHYRQFAERCRTALESRQALDDVSYADLMEEIVREALRESLDSAEFHELRTERERAEVNRFLSLSTR